MSEEKRVITRTCVECGKLFTISIGEQIFYQSKHFNLPKRCKQCRRARKRARANERVTEECKKIDSYLGDCPYELITLKQLSDMSDNTLYIIGNGFDLMHGAKSSYWDFQATIGKNNSLRSTLETYLKTDNLWGDFEHSLSCLDVRPMLDSVDMFLDMFDAYDVDAQMADMYAAIDDAMWPIQDIINNLPRRFRRWIESVKPAVNCKLFNPNIHAEYLNFNYTEFLESIYEINHNRILYIHGCRKDRDPKSGHRIPLVLGHAPGAQYGLDQYEPDCTMVPHYKNGFKRHFLDLAMQIAVDNWVSAYQERFTKKSDQIIRDNIEWFNRQANRDNIVIIGHSLSEVDWPYLGEIVERNASQARWYFSWHSLRDLESIEYFCRRFNLGAGNASHELFLVDMQSC